MEDKITHEIDLSEGYTDQKNVVHKHVVFGKSVSAKRLLALLADPQAQYNTQLEDLLLSESIVEFGTTPIPVPLTTLAQLGEIDRQDLAAGRDEYRQKLLGERRIVIKDDSVELLFGIKVGELRYTIVQFGARLTGKDEVDADKAGLKLKLARRAFLAGRSVVAMRTPAGNEVRGPVEFATLNSDDVDEDDLFALVSASELWRQSFRFRGRTIQNEGKSANSSAAGDENGMDGGGDSKAASGAA